MNRASLFLRTLGWGAVGFLLANGVVLTLLDAVQDGGDLVVSFKQLAIASIAALAAGLIAALGLLRFGETPGGRALAQFTQMLAAGLATLAVADLTTAAAVTWVVASGRMLLSAAIGALQAYLVNRQAQPGAAPNA